ncbi:MAG: hypothetical protein ABSG02_03880 [Terriglobales bacterium]|jgi:hypothetical protein
MKLGRLQEFVFRFNVLQNIEQQQQIEAGAELRVTLMNVIAVKRAKPAHVLLKRDLIEIKPRY